MKKQFKIFAMTFLLFYLTGCNNDSALEETASEDSFKLFTLINDQDGNYLFNKSLPTERIPKSFLKTVYTPCKC